MTEEDIEEMRSRGFEPATLERARLYLRRTREDDRLIERIATAFDGVVLGHCDFDVFDPSGLYDDECLYFTALNPAQREVTRDYCRFQQEDPDNPI